MTEIIDIEQRLAFYERQRDEQQARARQISGEIAELTDQLDGARKTVATLDGAIAALKEEQRTQKMQAQAAQAKAKEKAAADVADEEAEDPDEPAADVPTQAPKPPAKKKQSTPAKAPEKEAVS